MVATGEFYDAITQWQTCAEQVEHAEANRNYRDFQVAYREARRQFKIIRDAIIEGLHESMGSDQRDRLVNTTKTWDRLTARIEDWKNEMAQEAEKVRRNSQRGRKVAKGYGVGKKGKPGTNFRLKAT